jgi:hypothetical protein
MKVKMKDENQKMKMKTMSDASGNENLSTTV